MKPGERVEAVGKSRVEPSMRLLLVMVANHMKDDRQVCYVGTEKLAEMTGLAERQVRALLNEAEAAGIIRRWWGDYKTKTIAIDWEKLAAVAPKSSARGGNRSRSTGKDCRPGGKDCRVTGKQQQGDRQTLPNGPADVAPEQVLNRDGTGRENTPPPPTGAGPAPAGPECVPPDCNPTPTMETPDGHPDDRAPDRDPAPVDLRESGDGGGGRGVGPDTDAAGASEAGGGGGGALQGEAGGAGAPVTPCTHPALDDDTGACAACGASMDDVRLDTEQDRALAEHFRGGSLFGGPPPVTPSTKPGPRAGLPTWTPPTGACNRHDPAAVVAMVVRGCEAMVGQPRNPHACGTNARPILALWRTLGAPDPVAFGEDLALVVAWAQRSPDPLAQNDLRGIRADGSKWKGDHSRTMATLCVQERWDVRLEAARAWHDNGEPEGMAATPPTRGGRPDATAAWSTFEALGSRVHRGDPLPEAEDDHQREVLDVFRRSVGWRRWYERSSFTRPAIQRDFAAAWSSTQTPPPERARHPMEQA